jgi:hypothetical protein
MTPTTLILVMVLRGTLNDLNRVDVYIDKGSRLKTDEDNSDSRSLKKGSK